MEDSVFGSMLSIRRNIRQAIDKDYNINHIITFLAGTVDEFIIDVFTDGLVTVVDPKTKQLISMPRVISTVRTKVAYANLVRFMKLVERMITHYDKPKNHIIN